ncbi:hypothetical protein GQ44DRAFT_608811 [Phaeosphaeriaceae sp. PMI808]|nr:hypothetical protein GQ44DRAFT_608811 [Phaeosphaeriaceae sp. PMI808]
MLPRITGRRLRNGAFLSHAHNTHQQLTLPRLYSNPTQSHDSRRSPRRPSLSPRHDTRSLATTAELQPTPQPSSFHGFMQAWGSNTPPRNLAHLSPWDPSNPLIVLDSTTNSPIAMSRKTNFSIGGDAVELHQNLYACLKVSRIDRAAIVLDRLSTLFPPSAPEMLDAHNIFMKTLFELAVQSSTATPDTDAMARIEQWYDKNMVQKGIQPNADTYVTLLRASMNFLDGIAQEEAIRKYMDMAHEHGEDMVLDINYSSEFTDEEWNVLIGAQPEEFEEPPSVEEMQDMLVNPPAAQRGLVDYGLMPPIPRKIKPVWQKGLGMDSLKQALAALDTTSQVEYPHDMEGTQEEKDLSFAYARQIQMEQRGLEASVERWKQEDQKLQDAGVNGVLNSKPVQALMFEWYSALLPMFKKHIKHCKDVLSAPTEANAGDPAHSYGPWLERCPPEKLAAITISRAVSSVARSKEGGAEVQYRIAGLSVKIGGDIADYLNTDAQERRQAFLRLQRKETRTDVVRNLLKTQNKHESPSAQIPTSTQAPTSTNQWEKTRIPLEVRTRIGALALEYLLQACTMKITVNDPKTGKEMSTTQAAFRHNVGFHLGKKVGYIVPHYHLLAKLRTEPVHAVTALNLPMVAEPRPWSSFQDGGYYTLPQKVVRQKAGDPSQRAYAQSAIENGDMAKVLAGLDVLGKVPWQINNAILNVMTDVWNKGEGIGAFVPEVTDLQRPDEPPAEATYDVRTKWAKKLQLYENAKSGFHSQRCFQNFQLETARAFASEKKIYFPHSVDFRGRAYPLPPILNHIGSDISRGLLKFARGKELGEVGLQWLKIHLANLYGYDKASLKEREQFAMNNLDEVYDSATKPLDGRRWWTKAEDPWQFLACCMELKNALDSPDPTRFVSQFPVHQDGTCNGLQHYAALGGDHAGARQVNLEPSGKPQDIYTGVADLVKEMVAKDVAKGHKCAKFIDGYITRKVVKRTVMTNVYGVTFMGAKAQVEDELKSIFPNFRETDTIKNLGQVALYVAFNIFEALGKIFNGAQEIQYWLGECGERITTSLTPEQIKSIKRRYEGGPLKYDPKYKSPKKIGTAESKKLNKQMESFRTSIIWTTPLQMPIVQPYRKDSIKKIKTKLQDITVVKRSSADNIDKRKQLQAFAPNFIHSLDASHMTLSALKCSEMGIDFAAVHDSFWTHASDIPKLNVILRDAFVRMHSEDIVQRLGEEFKARYAGHMYLANIWSSSVVAQKIRKWRVEFYRSTGRCVTKNAEARHGHASIEELALEAQRQDLLNSEDPKQVKKGEKMETPTSIWLENQDPKALSSYRLSFLGETKKSKPKFDQTREKILEKEAEAIAGAKKGGRTETEAEAPKELSEKAKNRAYMRSHMTTTVWVPLTFPPVPTKGGWDVSRLRESTYFFS